MSPEAKTIEGITLILIPTIQFGGSFLLRILNGGIPASQFTDFQRAMFRAGHAHAGVLVLLCLIAQPLIDEASLPAPVLWPLRIGFMAAPMLISGGFFGGAARKDRAGPLIALLWLGFVILAACTVTLGVGLLS